MLYGHGIKPIDLADYTWADVIKTMHGIRQAWEPIREAAFLIHCSLIPKKDRVKREEWMPIPFDEDMSERENSRRMDYEEVKERLRQVHGN